MIYRALPMVVGALLILSAYLCAQEGDHTANVEGAQVAAVGTTATTSDVPVIVRPWTERVMDALNPSQTCPHCHKVISQKRSFWWLIVGFVGQLAFTGRFLVQWIASERRKQSYIPVSFWYLSIVGTILLFAYAISIMAWPIILGQGLGVFVYGRNLALIARHEKTKTDDPRVEE